MSKQLRWFRYKFDTLKAEFDRLEEKWASDITPGDRFVLARDHYWLSLQLGKASRTLRAVIMQTSPLHDACWVAVSKGGEMGVLCVHHVVYLG